MTFTERCRNYVNMILSEHQAVFDAQNMEELLTFIQTIMEARRIFVVGAGREGIAARSFAMRMLIDRLKDPNGERETEILPVELVLRGSEKLRNGK